jgi:UDP-N-acetylmuramoyl-L-alanyl-D-glutamate--2,6-diaminopimelate ligase
MRIAELIKGLPIEVVRGPDSTDINGIAEDSRRCGPGCLFVARGGTRHDGQAFIGQAVGAGAAAVLAREPADVPEAVPVLVTRDPAHVLGALANRFYGHPAERLRLVGVTGTNGKTTICHLVRHLLTRSGLRCGLIGTVEIDDGRRREPASMTTPSALEISRVLRAMVDHGCSACVIEVSSHALSQGRVSGLDFAAAVFSNLSGDHLDYHRSAEEYAAAKSRLFADLGPDAWAVFNVDDPAAEAMIRVCRGRVIRTSLRDPRSDCFATIRKREVTSTRAVFEGPWGAFETTLPLAGRHNVANALQAAAAAAALGLGRDDLRAGLAECTAPAGRLEPIAGPPGSPTVLVDYAHSDDALESVLRSLHELRPEGGRLVVVFGCGGDRDRTKRPRMGKAAARWADRIVVTSDNPRSEDPDAIIEEILAGIPPQRLADTEAIACRRTAISRAIAASDSRDVVLIAGKGHEDYQIVGSERRSFDDRLVAAEALHAVSGSPC